MAHGESNAVATMAGVCRLNFASITGRTAAPAVPTNPVEEPRPSQHSRSGPPNIQTTRTMDLMHIATLPRLDLLGEARERWLCEPMLVQPACSNSINRRTVMVR